MLVSHLSLHIVFIVRGLQVFIVISKSKKVLKCFIHISHLAPRISPELFISLEEMLHSTADLPGGSQDNIQCDALHQLSEVKKF